MNLKVRRLNMGESGVCRLKMGILEGFFAGVLCLFPGHVRADEAAAAPTEVTEGAVVREGAQLDARASYALGQQAYKQKEYAEAERYFKRAHRLKPHPTTLKMIAECRLGQGDILSAVAMMAELLKDESYPDQKRLNKRFLRLKAKLSDSQLERLPSLDVSDLLAPAVETEKNRDAVPSKAENDSGEEEAPAAVPAVPAVPAVDDAAADHVEPVDGVEVGESSDVAIQIGPGEADAGPVDVAGGQVDEHADGQDAGKNAAASGVPEEPVSEPRLPLTTDENPEQKTAAAVSTTPSALGDKSEEFPRAFWAFSAVAGIGLVSGTVFGTMALRDEKDYEDAPNSSTRDSGRRASIVADVSFGLALASAVASALVLISDKKKKKKKGVATESGSRVTVQPSVNFRGAGVAAGISFH
jgi:hypothetical protein